MTYSIKVRRRDEPVTPDLHRLEATFEDERTYALRRDAEFSSGL
jgi:hypothetical protein